MRYRIALKILYDGTSYHGFQRQPHVRTVEGEIEEVLRSHKCIESLNNARYAASGRTDKGVSAIGQTIILETTCKPLELIEYINTLKPRIYAWAYRVDTLGEFHPRYWAIYREYIYVHKKTKHYNIDRVHRTIDNLIGCRDYSFLGLPKDTNPYRCLFRIKVFEYNGYIVYRVVAESFARQMVRRIVSLLKNIAEGVKDNIKPMPPQNLVLVNVKYPYEFHIPLNLREELIDVVKYNARRVIVFDLLYHLFFSSSSWIDELS